MTVRFPVRIVALAWLAGSLCGQPVMAQSNAPATAPASASDTGEAGPATPSQPMAGRVAKQIADLHKRLHITPAQQPQWDAFAAIMRDNAAHSDQAAKARDEAMARSAVEELRALATAAEARAQDVQRLVPVFEALYGAMTPEQQKMADAAMHAFARRTPRGIGRP